VIIREQENESAGLLIPDPAPVAAVTQTDEGQNDAAKDVVPPAT
jgi:hypothetical protein